MKMQLLKKKVRRRWEQVNSYLGKLTASESAYIKEIKAFGDRRYKKTWIAALCRLEAISIYEGCLDAWQLIIHDLNIGPNHSLYEYRHEILDEFLAYSDAMNMIKMGLEQVFASSDFTADEQREARNNGFFELLEGRKEQLRGTSIPIGSIGQFAGTNA